MEMSIDCRVVAVCAPRYIHIAQQARLGGNRLWWQGKAEAAESGLQYFGARYYDPAIGRFMGIDPMGGRFQPFLV
jgi:RHS repeat-associated protein